MPEPIEASRPLRAYISSTAARSPAMAPTLLPAFLTLAATAAKASSQLAACSLPDLRT
ncbi:hypothetical protein D3C72_2589940 [compost metagenome]